MYWPITFQHVPPEVVSVQGHRTVELTVLFGFNPVQHDAELLSFVQHSNCKYTEDREYSPWVKQVWHQSQCNMPQDCCYLHNNPTF